jgi:DNA-binding transcriptional ArsR family regulator
MEAPTDDDARLDATFTALADPTRRAILHRLAGGEATVGELTEPFAMSQPAVSKHLKVLERAGLVTRRREAQRRPCRLDARPLRLATDWLAAYRDYWEASYQRLDRLLGELQATGDGTTVAPAGEGGEAGEGGGRGEGGRA